MTLFAYLDGVLVGTTNIRLRASGEDGIIGLPVAADGSGSMGGILFDDSAGSLSVTGWQIVKVNEADCTSAPTLFYGCVADRTYRRGKYRQGAAREIDTSIVDSNTFLSCRIVTGASANRPSETQATRIAWLLASDAVADPAGGQPMFADLGFVNGSTKVLDAANYRGMYPAEVLNDLCTSRQEIFFTYWDQARQRVGLFFNVPTATTFTCSLSVSNVLSDTGDIDSPSTTCFPPYIDGELVVDPQDVYTTGSMVYAGGTEYAIYAPTYSFFDAPSPILTRSFRVENDKVGKATTAHALLELMLAADSTERETLKFTVRLPSTKVGLIQAGMRIQCRFSHLPGFTSFTYTRIERLNYVPVDGDPTHYDVSVECSLHGLSTGIGSGAGSTTPFPFVPPPAATPTEYCCTQLVAGAGASDVRTEPGYRGTFSLAHNPAVHISALSVTGTLPTSDWVGMSLAYSWNGGALSYAAIKSQVAIGQPGYPGGTQNICWNAGGLSACTGTESGTPPTFPILIADNPSSADNTFEIWGLTGLSGSTATVTFCITLGDVYDQSTATIVPNEIGTVTGPESGPRAGNPVGPEVVTMTGATGTTAFPFAVDSLRVFVDDVDHTDDLVSSDGATGTFHLDFIPYSFEVVRVEYVAA